MKRHDAEVFAASKLDHLLGRMRAAGFDDVVAESLEQNGQLWIRITGTKEGQTVERPVLADGVSEEALLATFELLVEKVWCKRSDRN